jgi:Flp pilus assembly protein TadG
MVEFALVLPLMLIVLFIVVDFGVGLTRWISVTNAAREGARCGAIGAADAEITQRVVDTSNGLVDPAKVSVQYPSGQTVGDSVVVDVDYDYNLITPLGRFLTLAFSSITFSAASDMYLDQAPPSGATCP